MHLKFANQTVVVRGDYAALLMDFYGGKMQRISLAAADLLSTATQGNVFDPSGFSDAENSVLSKLKERGFLHHVCADNSRMYTAGWTLSTFPILRTLSIEIDTLSPENLAKSIDFALASHRYTNMYNVAIFCVTSSYQDVFRVAALLLSGSEHLIVDIVVPSTLLSEFSQSLTIDHQRIRISALPQDRIPGKEQFQIPPVDKRSFFCRQDFYSLLRISGESNGCLHVGRNGDVFPDPYEADVRVGHISSLNLDQVLDSSAHYWGSTKDHRAKCRGCEYRFACPNTIAARSDRADFHSAPKNCSYHPAKGVWA